MRNLTIPFTANMPGTNTYTLLFNQIQAQHPTLGIDQTTHFVKTIKQLPTRVRPSQSIAVIGSRTDAAYEERFRYDRWPISRYLTNPLFSVEELPIVQGLDEIGLLAYLTTKLGLNFNNLDFVVRNAGIVYTGGEVRPNWRVIPAPESPFWYHDQILWLHGGSPVDPGPDPDPLTIVYTYDPPFSNPYTNPVANETVLYTDYYIKAKGLFSNVRAAMDVWFSGNFTVDYTPTANTVLINEHIPHNLTTGLVEYADDYSNDATSHQFDILNQGFYNGYAGVFNDTLAGHKGIYTSYSTWNEEEPDVVGSPAEIDVVVPQVADFYGSVPFMVSRQPYMIEIGFRPSVDTPVGSTWVDNMGLPGVIGAFFGTDQKNLTFDGPLAGFSGVVKRGAYGKHVADLLVADIRCGVLYRDGMAQVIVNGTPVLQRTIAFGIEMFMQVTLEFFTLGANNVTYLGVAGHQQALAEGQIPKLFSNIKAKCTMAEVHMGEVGTYQAISAGNLGNRTRTVAGGSTTFAATGASPTFDFNLADSVFYTVSDCVCTSPLYGIRSWVDVATKYDKELMTSRVITP
jgi:hypothetical protein